MALAWLMLDEVLCIGRYAQVDLAPDAPFRLLPDNPHYPPIEVDRKRGLLIGVVVQTNHFEPGHASDFA